MNSDDYKRLYPLHHIALLGNEKQLLEILNKGQVVIDTVDNEGRTALTAASIRNGAVKRIKILIAHGANPRIPDSLGNSALMYAEQYQGCRDAIPTLKRAEKNAAEERQRICQKHPKWAPLAPPSMGLPGSEGGAAAGGPIGQPMIRVGPGGAAGTPRAPNTATPRGPASPPAPAPPAPPPQQPPAPPPPPPQDESWCAIA
jgi:hypothetical protein